MYTPFTNFILRTPLLPFNNLNNLLKDKEAILACFESPSIQEALYLASPDLFQEIGKLKEQKITSQKEIDRILFSMVRYISRMSSRCTPFGLFAGCSVGEISGENTNFVLSGSFGRHTRLDMYYLSPYLRNYQKSLK